MSYFTPTLWDNFIYLFHVILCYWLDCSLGATNRDNLVHPTRAIQFLVGTRGKNETLAIGGPWSPSLDGPNPESDPSVLIRTAIRVCRALTGIDLTNCTQWHRFLEIHYRWELYVDSQNWCFKITPLEGSAVSLIESGAICRWCFPYKKKLWIWCAIWCSISVFVLLLRNSNRIKIFDSINKIFKGISIYF